VKGLLLLVIAIIPVGAFAIGWALSKWNQKTPDMHYLVLAENLIDDLQIMASEHQQYDESFAVLAMEKIVEYRRERNQRK
jgi:hypothetical protein